MLQDPGPSAYDLRFRLFDVPVRVHPWFWIVSAIMGFNDQDPRDTLLWMGCIFVSILIHEFGHALVSKAYGGGPSVVLYSLGGLCISKNPQRDPQKRMAVIAAGPLAGLAFGLLVMVSIRAVYGIPPQFWLRALGLEFVSVPQFEVLREPSQFALSATFNLVWINLFWSLVNMAPIYPLDGGQFLQNVLKLAGRPYALYRTLQVSLLTAAGMAALLWFQWESLFGAIFMGLLAFSNFQAMQAVHERIRLGYEDDE